MSLDFSKSFQILFTPIYKCTNSSFQVQASTIPEYNEHSLNVLSKSTNQKQFSLDSGFSGTSAGQESACNAGDPSLIPGSGRSAGEGIGYPLQYSWASLAAQLVNNLPAMQETWV